jgi:hypothetical protein
MQLFRPSSRGIRLAEVLIGGGRGVRCGALIVALACAACSANPPASVLPAAQGGRSVSPSNAASPPAAGTSAPSVIGEQRPPYAPLDVGVVSIEPRAIERAFDLRHALLNPKPSTQMAISAVRAGQADTDVVLGPVQLTGGERLLLQLDHFVTSWFDAPAARGGLRRRLSSLHGEWDEIGPGVHRLLLCVTDVRGVVLVSPRGQQQCEATRFQVQGQVATGSSASADDWTLSALQRTWYVAAEHRPAPGELDAEIAAGGGASTPVFLLTGPSESGSAAPVMIRTSDRRAGVFVLAPGAYALAGATPADYRIETILSDGPPNTLTLTINARPAGIEEDGMR